MRALAVFAFLFLGGTVFAQEVAAPADFVGLWDSTYGTLTLEQKGSEVRGSYRGSAAEGVAGSLEGSVEGLRLRFRYREAAARGEGYFVLAPDGQSFAGFWRPDGAEAWQRWDGRRRSLQPSTAFAGLYQTSFGRLRLVPRGEGFVGVYEHEGALGHLEGELEGRRLAMRWREGERAGEASFLLDGAGRTLAGRWRSGASRPWRSWSGERVEPQEGRRWLLVIEAHWEEALQTQEYSFGAMLRSFFRRQPQVELRHRRFADRPDLERELARASLLAEPTVLLIASHGEAGALTVGHERIPAAELGSALACAPNLMLLHFSACEMMVGTAPAELKAALSPGQRLPISGYAVTVDWSASAVLELLYLDLILQHGRSPARAAATVRRELRFAGDQPLPGSPLGGAHFRFQE